MPPSLAEIVDDFEDEVTDLDQVLGDLDDSDWSCATRSPGWTVAHQVAHLDQAEVLATLAVRDPAGFSRQLVGLMADLDAVQAQLEEAAAQDHDELRARWRDGAAETATALRDHAGPDRIPWVSGPMRPATFAAARLMETFAHGHDVRAVAQQRPVATPRLRHVADLGVRTRGFSFRNRGLEVPPPPLVELRGPAGSIWSWGPADASASVHGDALEFCEVVTRRRSVVDTALVARGPGAADWLDIAQAFAGPPADAPPPTG